MSNELTDPAQTSMSSTGTVFVGNGGLSIFDKTRRFTRARDLQKMGYYPYFMPIDPGCDRPSRSHDDGMHVRRLAYDRGRSTLRVHSSDQGRRPAAVFGRDGYPTDRVEQETPARVPA